MRRLSVADQGIDDPRIHLEDQRTHDRLVERDLAIQVDQFTALQAEVREPVRTLALTVDLVRQATLFPKAASEDFAASLLGHGRDGARDSARIATEPVGIENEHRFVNVLCHVAAPEKRDGSPETED